MCTWMDSSVQDPGGVKRCGDQSICRNFNDGLSRLGAGESDVYSVPLLVTNLIFSGLVYYAPILNHPSLSPQYPVDARVRRAATVPI